MPRDDGRRALLGWAALQSPRLVWEFVRTAGRAGAVAANYCEVGRFLRHGARVVGVAVCDRLSGERFEVRSRVVVNAAGPFAGQLGARSGARAASRIPLSRDMAVVIRRRLVRERALAVQTKYQDPDAYLSRGRRHLFVVPWRDVTLVGVNSTVYRGDPNCLTVTESEVEGFLDEINDAEPRFALTMDDVAPRPRRAAPDRRGRSRRGERELRQAGARRGQRPGGWRGRPRHRGLQSLHDRAPGRRARGGSGLP